MGKILLARIGIILTLWIWLDSAIWTPFAYANWDVVGVMTTNWVWWIMFILYTFAMFCIVIPLGDYIGVKKNE